MSLSEKEAKELEVLDNPQVEFLSSSIGGVFSLFFTKNKRKKRTIDLRIKLRMEEMGLDPKKDFGKYYELRAEEEKRYDERFGNKRSQ